MSDDKSVQQACADFKDAWGEFVLSVLYLLRVDMLLDWLIRKLVCIQKKVNSVKDKYRDE